jgi:hypothetical protein
MYKNEETGEEGVLMRRAFFARVHLPMNLQPEAIRHLQDRVTKWGEVMYQTVSERLKSFSIQ